MVEVKKSRLSTIAPLLATVGLCGVCFYAGGKVNGVTVNGKYLVADKNAVILAAVLERDSTDAEALRSQITQPILRVMRQYTDQGYVIIDGARDERGNFMIAALPAGTRDITRELAAAVTRKDPIK